MRKIVFALLVLLGWATPSRAADTVEVCCISMPDYMRDALCAGIVIGLCCVGTLCLLDLASTGGSASCPKGDSSWLGRTYKEVLRLFGQPSAVYSDGRNGAVISYMYTRTPSNSYTQIPGPPYDYEDWASVCVLARTSRAPYGRHSCQAYRLFWVNENGTIYKYKKKGV
ncbi:MAG: hypothetical protein ABIM88_09010 [candidate division WOR-3 bacterium]